MLGAGQAGAVPIPGPLEVRLDRAKAVVLGEVIRVKNTDSDDGTRWTRTTLSVKEVLKGDATDTIQSRSGYSESGHLGLHTVGNSGIWLIGADGRIVYPHGHLQEAQKPDVQRILKMLARRKWSGQVNGLKAWATVIDRRFAGRPGLLFAVMNCSKGEIFVPRPNCRPGILRPCTRRPSGSRRPLSGASPRCCRAETPYSRRIWTAVPPRTPNASCAATLHIRCEFAGSTA